VAIANQLDSCVHHSNSVSGTIREVPCYAQQARIQPTDPGGDLWAQLHLGEPLEISSVIFQPAKVVQDLYEVTFVGMALVFDDDRTLVTVETQRVNASTMSIPCAVFGRQETHAQEGL
jgi:hypothetical protein